MAIGPKLYSRGLPNPPSFSIKETGGFQLEKDLLIRAITSAHDKGPTFYEGKRHPIFGVLTANEWSRYFLKHLDHHLRQFGV